MIKDYIKDKWKWFLVVAFSIMGMSFAGAGLWANLLVIPFVLISNAEFNDGARMVRRIWNIPGPK